VASSTGALPFRLYQSPAERLFVAGEFADMARLINMLDADSQVRFNKSCTEAVVNYMNASGAAYQAMAQQMLQMWGQSVDNLLETAQQQTNSRSLAPQSYSAERRNPMGAAACMMPWAAIPNGMMNANPMATLNPFGMPYGVFTPFAPWLEMMKPSQFNAWPMAFGMISVGVPEQVAWPTARANVAALDAFNVAANSVEKALADYRTEANPSPIRTTSAASNPFSVAFSITPFNPNLLMQFFSPFRSN